MSGFKGDISILYSRLTDKIPEAYHDEVEKVLSRYEMEVSMMADDDEGVGQALLTRHEMSRLKTRNQHQDPSEGHTIVELQCIKAAAIENGVRDWTSRVDSTLSKRENINRMRQYDSH